MPSSTLSQSQTDFFGSTIVWDYLATVNTLLVRTLKIYQGVVPNVDTRVNGPALVYADTRCARHSCRGVRMHSWACGVMRVGVRVHVPVSIHVCVCIGQSCAGAGLGPRREWNTLPEGVKTG